MPKHKIFINNLIIFSFLFLSFISAALFFKSHIVYVKWDTQFYFKRIIELRESIIYGGYLPNFSLNEFHGSSIMSLYPYFNLIPVAFFSFIIKSKIYLIYSFFIFNTLLTFIISFYSSKKYVNSYITSYIFSIVYSLSGVFLYYNFLMYDIGVVYSYIFLPLIIFGFIEIIKGKNNWIELSIGMSLILFSHILNLIIIGFFLLIFLIINLRNINKYVIKNLLKALLLFVIITSIVWVPFIYVYASNFNNINMPKPNRLNSINIKMFMSGLFGSKTIDSIGFFQLISLFTFPFVYKKNNKYIKQIYLLSLITVIIVIFLPLKFITSIGIFKLLNVFQFTWRFLLIPQMNLSFIFALIITKNITSLNKRRILCLFTILFAVVIQFVIGQYKMVKSFSNSQSINQYVLNKNKIINMKNNVGYYIRNSEQFNLLIHNTYNSEDNDYIPIQSIPISSFVNSNNGFYNGIHKITFNHNKYNTFSFNGKKNINKLSLPIYVYNKEKLYVYLNGKLVNNYANNNGLLTINHVHNNIKSNNNVYIKPASNLFKIMVTILSIFGWLFILCIVIKRKIYH